ncbi:hypothetical protein EDB19DRAFT_1702429, partial [Suillus lakei]
MSQWSLLLFDLVPRSLALPRVCLFPHPHCSCLAYFFTPHVPHILACIIPAVLSWSLPPLCKHACRDYTLYRTACT